MLMTRENLGRTDPASIPQINRWGRARQSVLEATDGHSPLREIEHQVFLKHPDLFPDQGSAALFVSEVITRYSV